MKAALYTPMPPARTGVAHYASMVAPALAKHIELEVISSADQQPSADDRIYQLGNNPHHEWIYKAAMQHAGIIVLHDIVLHHLIVEMTLARGDAEGYIHALRASHGEAGAAWGRGRAAGLHSEMGNFLLPASIDVANRSKGVIVHNRYAADRLRSLGVRTPISVVPHPYQPEALSIRPRPGVIGFFGFLTSAKRAEVVLAAFREAREIKPELKLLVVGEPAPNIDLSAFQAAGITFTGYVPDQEFARYFAEVDRVVNLRYPSAGETSGTLIRAFDAGKPVAVSDYAQFAELPDDCVVKIPLGEDEVPALADFFTRELRDPSHAQRAWLEKNARLELTVAGYLSALQHTALRTQDTAPVSYSLPLFVKLELVSATRKSIVLRNAGDVVLRARQYGEPGYHVVLNGRWLELPRDLPPGQMAEISLPSGTGEILELWDGVQGVPALEPEIWGRAALR